ncbi:unnamed protein product, partial [marine sediment metagenome]
MDDCLFWQTYNRDDGGTNYYDLKTSNSDGIQITFVNITPAEIMIISISVDCVIYGL